MKQNERSLYRTGQFAEKAGVTKRTLRYYDRLGLLKPEHRTESGQRLYSEDDFVRLQQIVTLKFVGFSLEQIRKIIDSHDIDLAALLSMQREWMEGKLRHLQLAIQAIKDAERAIRQEAGDVADKFQRIIGVIEMQSHDWLNEFIAAAISGREEAAKAIKAANPGLAGRSIHAAAVLGDAETVRAMLERDASLAVQKGGPEHWEPLLYLSFSCFLKNPDNSERFAQTAQLLLDRGANPNAYCLQKDDPLGRKLSALYGVVGIANNAVVGKVLLEIRGGHQCDHRFFPQTRL